MSVAAMLSLDDVGFSYGPGRFAVRDVSLEVGRGELVGLLGPNGSGKSTLLRLVMRLLSPGAGRIEIAGRRLGRFSRREYARHVAYLPQQSRAAFAYTALETVMMGRSPHLGTMGFESEADRRASLAALERVDAARFADAMLDELSGGERQRVVLARALAQEADLLLLDEPASFLDVRHQFELYGLLRELAHAEGRACLCVGHDLNVASAYCDRLVLLSEGRVAAAGPPAEVITAERLRGAYGVDADVIIREDGRPMMLPRAASEADGGSGGTTVAG